MLASLLSSFWFAFLLLALGVVLICWPVLRVNARLRKSQSHREALAMAQAQAAMVEWRKNRPELVSQSAGSDRSSE